MIHLLTCKCEHKHWAMLLLFYAQRQTWIIDMLFVVILSRCTKFLLHADIFITKNINSYKTRMIFGWPLKVKVDTFNVVYNIGEQPIDRVSEVRDLGIIVDSSLKFTSHINSIVSKANGRAALIRKCFVSHNPDVMIRAFKVYVRPLLEYAVSVWSPCYNYAIDKVESVYSVNLPKGSGAVKTWITQLDLIISNYSLERRRLIADLVLTYRIIFGLIDLDMSDYFTLQSSSGCSATTCGNPYKLCVNHCRINVRKHFFSERIIKVWNSLPPSIVSFESLSMFSKSLGNVNLCIHTKYWSLSISFIVLFSF